MQRPTGNRAGPARRTREGKQLRLICRDFAPKGVWACYNYRNRTRSVSANTHFKQSSGMNSRGNNNQFRSVALIQRGDLARFNSTVSAELQDETVPPTERRRTPLRDAASVEREEVSWRRDTGRDERQVRGRGRRPFGRTTMRDDDLEPPDRPQREHVSAYLDESSVVSVSRRSERGFWADRDEEESPHERRTSRRSRREEQSHEERQTREERTTKRRSRFRLSQHFS